MRGHTKYNNNNNNNNKNINNTNRHDEPDYKDVGRGTAHDARYKHLETCNRQPARLKDPRIPEPYQRRLNAVNDTLVESAVESVGLRPTTTTVCDRMLYKALQYWIGLFEPLFFRPFRPFRSLRRDISVVCRCTLYVAR